MEPMEQNIPLSSIVFHGVIAFFGALVHAANAHRKGTSKTLLDFLMLVIMSSFTGVIFALVGVHYFPEQQYLTMAFAGTGGYLGVEGMSIIIEKGREVLIKK